MAAGIILLREMRTTSNASKFIQTILLLCFFVVPLIVWPDHFQPFIALKQFIFAGAVLLCAGGLALSLIIAKAPAFERNRLMLAVGMYYAYNLGSCLLFPYTDRTAFFFFTCLLGVFLLVSMTADIRFRDRMLATLIVVAGITSIYGWFQFFGKDFLGAYQFYFEKITIGPFVGGRIFTTFGHPNLVSGFCVGLLPIITVILLTNLRQRQYLRGGFLVTVCLLTLCALLFSRTRGSWLAVICSFGVLELALAGKALGRLFRKYPFGGSLSLIMLSLSALSLFLFLQQHTSLLNATTSLTFRAEYYKNTVAMIAERPWFGRGFGTFNVYYPLYRNHRTAARLGEPTNDYRVEHPHNEHLEILSDGGVVGYSLFLWLVSEALILLFKRNDVIELGIAAALVGLLCDGLFSQNLRFIVIASLFWLLLGFANRPDSPSQHSSYHPIRALNFCRIGGMLLVICVLGGLLRFAYHVMQADYYVKIGMSAYAGNALPQAVAAFQEALARDSRNKRALYYCASAYNLQRQQEQAIAAYTRLQQLDPNFLQTNFHLGVFAFRNQAFAQAKTYFKRQIAADNLHWQAYYNLALLELSRKNAAQAQRYVRELEQIDEIQPVDAGRLAQLKQLANGAEMPKMLR